MKKPSRSDRKYAWGSEQMSNAVRRYLRREQAHGKSTLARSLDMLLLFVIVFAVVWLYLCSKGIRARHALLPAGIAVLFFAVLYRMYALWKMQRFLPKEAERISKKILRQRMPFLERSAIQSLFQKIADIPNPIVFYTAEAVTADQLMPYLCDPTSHGGVFCAMAGFTKTAQNLAEGREPRIKLIGTETLLAAAMEDDDLRPKQEEVFLWIEHEESGRKRRRKQARAFPQGGGIRRYIVTAGLLFLFSFRTGYAVYYRMLASLCMTIAVLRGYLVRTAHTERAA